MCEVKPQIKFGTDGFRGVISDNFTFESVRRLSQAIADYYIGEAKERDPSPDKIHRGQDDTSITMAVGYDTRFLSNKYALTAAGVLSNAGIEVILSDRPLPTPALSFAVKNRRLSSGIMITASHNPAEYNGIKIKTAPGGAAGVEVTKEVERLIDQNINTGRQKGNITTVDLTKDYAGFLRRYIHFAKIKNCRFKVLVDPMHGSGNGFIASVLKGSSVKLEFIRQDINPGFEGLRPEPIVENLMNTARVIKKGDFDLCIVLDGDADRIAAFTGGGEFINPQKILGLLILHLVCDRKMKGAVVKTIVGTNMLDNITRALGLKLYETPVGFKYISELMLKEDILVGGEEAGGIGFKNYIPERDGTLAGLLLLEMMSYRRKSMAGLVKEMEKEFGRYYYLKDHFSITDVCNLDIQKFRDIKEVLGQEVVDVKDHDGVKLICKDTSWLMFRGSGTEPIIRVYAEAKTLSQAKKMIDFGKGLVLTLGFK